MKIYVCIYIYIYIYIYMHTLYIHTSNGIRSNSSPTLLVFVSSNIISSIIE